jgi:hypothetical protein
MVVSTDGFVEFVEELAFEILSGRARGQGASRPYRGEKNKTKTIDKRMLKLLER